MNDSPLIRSHLKSVEAQLRVLEALTGQSPTGQSPQGHTFGELFGLLSGKVESTDEEVESVLYETPAVVDDEE